MTNSPALTMLHDEERMFAAAVREFAEAEIKPFIEALPRTATGKIQKNLLREKYWQGRGKRVG
jgi:acyl-CoA synthetase (AMP-forming)/AMP-acid ligase II